MIAYLDMPSGLSGDMMLGCLVDAGWPVEELRGVIGRVRLPAVEWRVEAAAVMRGPLRATQVAVHAHEGHTHRHLRHIRELIDAGDLPADVKARAIAVFTRLAEAEAKVHGTTPEKIHFHEVGAVDAIIDIVGSVAGLAALGIDTLHASAVPVGSGWVESAHGRIPVPAPATVELLAAAKAPLRESPGDGELLTPTGAALLAELATFGPQPAMTVERTGIGAGGRDRDWPNVARLWIGQLQHASQPHSDGMVQLETNVDDMNPQLYPVVTAKLLAAGAADVWLTPVHMKKGRPGMLISVLASAGHEATLCDVLLRETTTLGVRALPVMHRAKAERELAQVTTPYGEITVKLKRVNGKVIDAVPEFEDCLRQAQSHGVAVRAVQSAAAAAGRAMLG